MPGRSWFLPIAGMLTGTAWLALVLWERSPYGRYLEHANWTEVGLGATICRATPAAGFLLPAVIYAGGWLLMIAAMMLPTTLPLLRQFLRVVAARRSRGKLIMLLIGGYMLAWIGFSIAAHSADAVLHLAARRSVWLAANGWLVGAAVLATAGLFQFTALKYRCLDKCRTPFSFIAQHWRGRAPYRDALRLGLHHGLFCVGCCWAIMLLMFVVGTANLGWMLLLGTIMAVEKNASWGRRVARPLGLVLLLGAGLVLIAG